MSSAHRGPGPWHSRRWAPPRCSASIPTTCRPAALLSDAADCSDRTRPGCGWPWPEQRLTYANATLTEAMIAAGSALDRPALMQHGLDLLEWLLDRETRQGHLSVTPVGGSGPDDDGPGFDQQPIEVAALADACARAQAVDGNQRWVDGITAAANWFLGDNDSGVVMWDPETGGAFDGLRENGANLNQGTESTLALLSTMQHARIARECLAMTGQASSLARRSPVRIAADRSRVVTRLFVPGHEGFDQQESRSSTVLQRVLALPDDEVQRSLDDVVARFERPTSRLDRDFSAACRRALRSPRSRIRLSPNPPPAARRDLHE